MEDAEYEEIDRQQCNYCPKMFALDVIERHMNICKKHQEKQQKRKKFDSVQQRLENQEGLGVQLNQKQIIEKKKLVEQVKQGKKGDGDKGGKKQEDMPKWKQQSLLFRQQMKGLSGAKKEFTAEEARELEQAKKQSDQQGIKCEHCGRQFNETAGPRHIKFCAEQQMKNKLKGAGPAKPGPKGKR